MYLSEKLVIVPAMEPADKAGAGDDTDSINIGDLNWLTFVITFGALTGDSVLKLYTGAAVATKTTAETFTYRLASGDFEAASADLYGTPATSAALTLTAATYDHKILIVEVDPATLTDAQPFVTLEISAVANPCNVAVVAIGEPRYAVSATVLA